LPNQLVVEPRKLAAGKIVVDGLLQIIERRERPGDEVAVRRPEIVAGNDADADRIAGILKLLVTASLKALRSIFRSHARILGKLDAQMAAVEIAGLFGLALPFTFSLLCFERGSLRLQAGDCHVLLTDCALDAGVLPVGFAQAGLRSLALRNPGIDASDFIGDFPAVLADLFHNRHGGGPKSTVPAHARPVGPV